MKPPLVLLYTRDQTFDQVLARALFGTGTIILIARGVGDALQIVCRRGRELDFAVLDFNDGSRGMALLSALHTCCDKLPTLVITSKDLEHASAVAYANGARVCLTKPLPAALLANAIADLHPSHSQLVVA
jgi:ActR/RegA family two-component response regulator